MLYRNDNQLLTDENSSFSLAALSTIGDREDQQDSFGYNLKREDGLMVLCDGMGGHEGGKMAGESAVEAFLAKYDESHMAPNQTDILIETAKKADFNISQLKNAEGRLLKAGSTLVSIVVNRKKLIWCSVGDSRAYLVRDGEMVQLTQDHNYNTVLLGQLKAGLLTEEQYKTEAVRGESLISYLGIGNLGLIDYSGTPFDLMKDDKIIMMSDGLYRIVSDDEIARILDNFNNIGEAVRALEMKAKKNAKSKGEIRDNMTVALIKIK